MTVTMHFHHSVRLVLQASCSGKGFRLPTKNLSVQMKLMDTSCQLSMIQNLFISNNQVKHNCVDHERMSKVNIWCDKCSVVSHQKVFATVSFVHVVAKSASDGGDNTCGL